MTFADVISLIGTLVGIASTIGGLMIYILKQNPTRKQAALVSMVIGIALVCVIILAEGISYLSTKSTFTPVQKKAITSSTTTVSISPVATVHVSTVMTVHVSSAGILTEFPLPDSHNGAYQITKGPDGNLWFTEDHGFGRISPGGAITEFPLQTNDIPIDLIIGPDSNLWFADNVTNSNNNTMNKIGRLSPNGTITEFPLPNTNSRLLAMTAGRDGNIWFTIDTSSSKYAFNGGKIGRMSLSGTLTEFPLPNSNSNAGAITAGPDGNIWFTEDVTNSSNFTISESKIGRISPSGIFTEFPLPNSSNILYGITKGPDGNVWFTENAADSNSNITESKIGRISLSGTFTEFPLSNSMATPGEIITGPDGNLWFTEYQLNLDGNSLYSKGKIGRISPNGTITEFPLPNTKVGPQGIATGPDGNLWFTADQLSSDGVSGNGEIECITSGK